MAGPRTSLKLDMVKMVQRTLLQYRDIKEVEVGLVEKLYSWEVKDEDE